MKKGKLVETGNHDSLLKNYPTGIYAKLVKQQEQVEEGEPVQQRLSNADTDQNQSIDSKQENKIAYKKEYHSTGKVRHEHEHDHNPSSDKKVVPLHDSDDFEDIKLQKSPSLTKKISKTSGKPKIEKVDSELLAIEKEKKEFCDNEDKKE